MSAIILVVIFIAYIGLGVPDSLIGTAWPAIYPEMGLDVSNVSFVSLCISVGTIVSSFMSERIVKRFKTGPVAAVSTVLTVIALLLFSLSRNMVWLCLSAIPQGFGAGSIDTALNNYVALHYKASQMNYLHCSYGIGVALSPFLMSYFLGDGLRWRDGYRTMFFIQLAIAVIVILSLPVWKKLSGGELNADDNKRPPVKFVTLLKLPAVRAQWGTFIGSCSLECLCLVWGGTYLVNAKGLPADSAARVITFYFAGLTLGRFVSGLLANRFSSKALVYGGQAITLAAIITLLLSPNTVIATLGLFLIGFGNGSFFPNMTQLTPVHFGRELSQAVIGTQMAFSYTAIMLTPILFGYVSGKLGINMFVPFLLASFLIMMGATAVLNRRLKRQVQV